MGGLTQERKKNSLQVDEGGEASSTLSWACAFLVQQMPLVKHGKMKSHGPSHDTVPQDFLLAEEKSGLSEIQGDLPCLWESQVEKQLLCLGHNPAQKRFQRARDTTGHPASGFRPLQGGKGHVRASDRADSATQL